MTEIEYCIQVLWLHGASIGDIHAEVGARSGKTKAAIRGLVDRAFDKPRSEMLREERQSALNELRANRNDGGILDISRFIAQPLRAVARKRAAPPEAERTKPVRVRLSPREARRRKAIEARAKERRESGLAPRGAMAAPLEYLYERGLLGEPGESKSGKVGEATAGNSMRRYQAGERFRTTLVSAYSSGLKTQKYDSVGGGGGVGVVIHASVVEALANVERIRGMLRTEEFNLLDAMLRMDVFTWQLPSKRGEAMVLEDIRRALDVVSVFYEMMNPDDFKSRWDATVRPAKPADGRAERRRSRNARDAIAAALRKMG